MTDTISSLETIGDNYKNALCNLQTINDIELKNANWTVMIDTSGSTSSPIKYSLVKHETGNSVLDTEVKFVKNIIDKINPAYGSISIIQWNSKASVIHENKTDCLKSTDGTIPQCVFENEACKHFIEKADALMIITDGRIDQTEVSSFGKDMMTKACHLKAVVGVLVTDLYRYLNDCKQDVSSLQYRLNSSRTPASIDVSVLVPAMISNACILCHDGDDTFVMWSSGAFRDTWNPKDIDANTTWNDLTVMDLKNVNVVDVKCKVHDSNHVLNLTQKGYIPIGDGVFVNPHTLLISEPSFEELIDLPFNWICQYFRVTDEYTKLYNWFKLQKERIVNEAIKSKYTKNIDIDLLINQINEIAPTMRKNHTNPTMTLYIEERSKHILQRYIFSDEANVERCAIDPELEKVITFFREMTRVMNEDMKLVNNAHNHQTSYTCSSLSATRYAAPKLSKANMFNSVFGSSIASVESEPNEEQQHPVIQHLLNTSLNASFSEPYIWEKQLKRLYPDREFMMCNCSVCHEHTIPFILISSQVYIEYLYNIDNPFNHFYSPMMCSKCADFFCYNNRTPSLFAESRKCITTLPIIEVNCLNTQDCENYIKEFTTKIVKRDKDQDELTTSYDFIASVFNIFSSYSSDSQPNFENIITFAKFIRSHVGYPDNIIIDSFIGSLN